MNKQHECIEKFNMVYKEKFSPQAQQFLTAIQLSYAADDSLWREFALTLRDDLEKINLLDRETIKSMDAVKKGKGEMTYEEEFKIYKQVSIWADESPELKNLLKINNLSCADALLNAYEWKLEFEYLLEKMNIHSESLVTVCIDIINRVSDEPENPDLQRIYCMLITDLGLLFPYDDRDKERDIRNYLKQKENTEKLLKAIIEQKIMKPRLEKLLSAAKIKNNILKDTSDESAAVYRLSLQHGILRKDEENEIYIDNIAALLQQINTNPYLHEVKPYLIAYVLSHRSGYMLSRENYQPNLESALRYTEYNIYEDNGKNFKSYQQSIELYMALRSYYQNQETVDIAFSDYCFANLSNLSDWFYENSVPDAAVPMKLIYKAAMLKAPMFPMLPVDTDVDSEKLEEDVFSVINNWI